MNAAVQAFYKYQGWDKDAAAYAQRYEKMLTPEQKKWGAYTYFIAKVFIDKQVSFTWHFP